MDFLRISMVRHKIIKVYSSCCRRQKGKPASCAGCELCGREPALPAFSTDAHPLQCVCAVSCLHTNLCNDGWLLVELRQRAERPRRVRAEAPCGGFRTRCEPHPFLAHNACCPLINVSFDSTYLSDAERWQLCELEHNAESAS